MTRNDKTHRWTLPSGATVEFTPFTPEAVQQAEMSRQLQEAGIALTAEQKAQLQQAIDVALTRVLTPEQQQIWQRYLSSQAASEQIDEGSFQCDPMFEAALKQAFIEAGAPLTPEQEARIEQLDQQMGQELNRVIQTHPLLAIGQFLASFVLPQPLSERMLRDSAVGRSIVNYIETIDQILTPEQQQIWQQFWNNRQQESTGQESTGSVETES